MGSNSKILINAARYIDAMYNIQIEEDHPNLEQIIQKIMATLDSPAVEKYWNAYQLEIDSCSGEKVEEQLPEQAEEKNVRYYRGVPIVEEGSSSSEDSDSKELSDIETAEMKNTDFLEKRQAKILPSSD